MSSLFCWDGFLGTFLLGLVPLSSQSQPAAYLRLQVCATVSYYSLRWNLELWLELALNCDSLDLSLPLARI
jgi:hypothetical protein